MGRGELLALAERVEAATGADRKLDVEVVAALHPNEWSAADLEYAKSDPDITLNPEHYTASLDAVLALAAEKLPGWYLRLEPRFHDDGERVTWWGYMLRPRWSDWRPDDEWFDRSQSGHCGREVSAALSAVLRALAADQDDGTGVNNE